MISDSNNNYYQIWLLAAAFRNALLNVPVEKRIIGLRCFPRGSCGDSSLLLSKFLEENGYDDFAYVCGWRSAKGYRRHSHAWLEKDGLIVDITADQFAENQESVIVANGSIWHLQFTDRKTSPSNYHNYDDETRASLNYMYRQIAEVLSSAGQQECVKNNTNVHINSISCDSSQL